MPSQYERYRAGTVEHEPDRFIHGLDAAGRLLSQTQRADAIGQNMAYRITPARDANRPSRAGCLLRYSGPSRPIASTSLLYGGHLAAELPNLGLTTEKSAVDMMQSSVMS